MDGDDAAADRGAGAADGETASEEDGAGRRQRAAERAGTKPEEAMVQGSEEGHSIAHMGAHQRGRMQTGLHTEKVGVPGQEGRVRIDRAAAASGCDANCCGSRCGIQEGV
jgi:hypothetical protein